MLSASLERSDQRSDARTLDRQRDLWSAVLKRELALINRFASFEAVFQTLYLLSNPGVDSNDIEMLHESLLGADPSGKEGRPGAAPQRP